MTTRSVEFYFDFGSPASYLAWTQLPHIVRRRGRRTGLEADAAGRRVPGHGQPFAGHDSRQGPYVFADLARFARRYGVPLQHNPHFPINTLLLMRGAIGMQMHEPTRFRAYVDAVFHAIWVEPRNMNDPATVGAVLQEAGFDAAKLLALANAQDVKDQLKATTQEAVRARRFRRADDVRRRPDVLGPGPARFRPRGALRLNLFS